MLSPSASDNLLSIQTNKIFDFAEKNSILNTNSMNSTAIGEKDVFVESFWYWNQFTSYVQALIFMIIILTTLTYYCQESPLYIGTLGTLSSIIEAMLGIPQFYLNWQRKNTEGLAPLLIMMWMFGDFYKLTYYYSYKSPLQLILCSLF